MPYERIALGPRHRAAAPGRAVAAPGGPERPRRRLRRPIVVTSVRGLLHPTLAPSRAVRGQRRPAARHARQSERPAAGTGWTWAMSRLPWWRSRASSRGGAAFVDVFPPASEHPVRVELFDDEIDSLRYFDPVTQRSLGPARRVAVAPPTEVLPRMAGAAADALGERRRVTACEPRPRRPGRPTWSGCGPVRWAAGWSLYAPYFSERAGLPAGPPRRAGLPGLAGAAGRDRRRTCTPQAEELKAQLVERGDLPAAFRRPYFTWEEILARGFAGGRSSLWSPRGGAELPGGCPRGRPRPASTPDGSSSSWTTARNGRGQGSGWCSPATRPAGCRRCWRSGAVTVRAAGWHHGGAGAGQHHHRAGQRRRGLGRPARSPCSPMRRSSAGCGRAARSAGTRCPRAFLSDLQAGDYVVHIEHGVGIFRGLDQDDPGGRGAGVPAPGLCRGRPALRAGGPHRPGQPLHRRRRGAARASRGSPAPIGSTPRPGSRRLSRTSPRSCWPSTPPARPRRATPSARTPSGSTIWRPASPTWRRRTSWRPSRT